MPTCTVREILSFHYESQVFVGRPPLQHDVEAAVWPEKAMEYELAAKRTGRYFVMFRFP